MNLTYKYLGFNDGDVMVVKVDTENSNRNKLHHIAEELQRLIGSKGIPVLIHEGDVEISKLSEEEMYKLGWQRVDNSGVQQEEPIIARDRHDQLMEHMRQIIGFS